MTSTRKAAAAEPKAARRARPAATKKAAAEVDAPAAPAPIANAVSCPHCRKRFDAAVDLRQPPRLQGAKCPNCKLFVPARLVVAARAATDGTATDAS